MIQVESISLDKQTVPQAFSCVQNKLLLTVLLNSFCLPFSHLGACCRFIANQIQSESSMLSSPANHCILCNQPLLKDARYYCDDCVEIAVNSSSLMWNQLPPNFDTSIVSNHKHDSIAFQSAIAINTKPINNNRFITHCLSKVDCIKCDGNGTISTKCPDCNGNTNTIQTISCPVCIGTGYFLKERHCEKCQGSGEICFVSKCKFCKGKGSTIWEAGYHEIYILDCVECEGNGKLIRKCSGCHGKGIEGIDVNTCFYCGGNGKIKYQSIKNVCNKCESKGMIVEKCMDCNGNGYVLRLDYKRQSKCDECELYVPEQDIKLIEYFYDDKQVWIILCNQCGNKLERFDDGERCKMLDGISTNLELF